MGTPGRGGVDILPGPGGRLSSHRTRRNFLSKGVSLNGFIYGESLLAGVTGLPSKTLQQARVKFLKKGEHWAMNGNHVAYEKKGAEMVLLKVLSPEAKPDEVGLAGVGEVPMEEVLLRSLLPGCGESEPEKEVPLIMARVHRFYLNRFMLGVLVPGVLGVVMIKVNSTKNFKRGMEVPLQKKGEKWVLARKLPRFPGRW